MIGGGAVNAIDVARLIKKYPEALRAGAFDPSLGRFGRIDAAIGQTIATAPNRNIIDPLAPRVASAESLGRSFTRFDEVAMKTSTFLSSSLAAIQFGSSIPNLIDAVGNEGPWQQNLYDNQSGRSGVLQFAGGGMGLGMLGTALVQSHRMGLGDPVAEGAKSALGRGVQRLIDSGKAPVMANPLLKYIGIGSGLAAMANEIGYFDAFDRGNTRSVATTLRDAARKTPVLNDEKLRTAAFGAGGALAAWKGTQAALKEGGLRNLGKGHIGGVAVAAGLLGANLLGAFGTLDR